MTESFHIPESEVVSRRFDPKVVYQVGASVLSDDYYRPDLIAEVRDLSLTETTYLVDDVVAENRPAFEERTVRVKTLLFLAKRALDMDPPDSKTAGSALTLLSTPKVGGVRTRLAIRRLVKHHQFRMTGS